MYRVHIAGVESYGAFSVYVMTDFRVNEIASSFRDILYNFKNLLYLLYRQDIGRPYDVIMPFGFFGITARVLIFLGVFLLVIRLILALQKRQTTLLWMIFFQLTGALLLGLLVTVGMTQINCIYIPLVLCGALCVSSLTDFLGKKVNFYGKIAVSILLAALLLGENVQFEKAYFTSYKELVSAYFQEGSEEAVQKAMEIAAERQSVCYWQETFRQSLYVAVRPVGVPLPPLQLVAIRQRS